MLNLDFESHNQQQSAVWDAYLAGRPERVPVVFTMNPRVILLDPELNDRGVSFADYVGDPAVMMQIQLNFHYWKRHNVLCDWPMGIPEREWEPFKPDWQNYQDAAWFGCELATHEGMMPRTYPMFQRGKETLHDCVMPDDLLRGNEPQIYAHYVYGLEHAPGVDFHGRPMAPPGPVFATASHPWTTACDLRGVTELCLDIYEDPDYVHLLMSFVTDASIARAKAWRRDAGMPVQFDPSEAYTLADDAIALLSPDAYREFVLPYHQRIVREMGGSERTRWHLCGEVGQHFETLVTEFGAESFDVGSCTDLAEVRRRLGPEVEFLGNIDPVLLLQGTVDDIENAVRRTMTCGVMEGGRYIMREGSNVAPRTPVRNLRAMYEAGKATGVYRA